MLRHLALGFGVFATTLSPVHAQEVSHPVIEQKHRFDSGYHAGSGGAPGTGSTRVWSQDVSTGGDWVQVHCRDSNLPSGSHLRLYSLQRPGWVQWHDAATLRDYDGWSCQLLGPTVRVELWAAPQTAGNRVLVDVSRSTFFGQGPDSICDTADDRVLSSDPRSCRLGAGCSAWLFSEYAVATAGHCMNSGSTGGVMLHFNVPPSTATGALVPSHPNDQYALGSFLQFQDGGVGADWAVMAALRNSNTQLFPGQAQGSWYVLGNLPGTIAGNLRVTGYGTGNGVSGSPTANQTQKTHDGAWVATSTAESVAYRADTTGGNSGSPILLDSTGEVVGVHTHGGCGPGTGANYGTVATRADWAAAQQLVRSLRTVGSFQLQGQGCGAAFGVPALTFGGVPELGRVFTVRVGNLNPAPGLLGVLMVGFSDTQWSGGLLPASLAPLGLQGCTLYVSDEGIDGMLAANGLAVRAYLIPNNASWLGAVLRYQYLGLDPTSTTAVGGVVSNAGSVRFGN